MPEPGKGMSMMGHDEIFDLLESVTLPTNTRQNTLRTDADQHRERAACLGLVENRGSGPRVSRATSLLEDLTRALCKWLRKELPGFKFISTQVNRNTQAAVHVDKNNRGAQLDRGTRALHGRCPLGPRCE